MQRRSPAAGRPRGTRAAASSRPGSRGSGRCRRDPSTPRARPPTTRAAGGGSPVRPAPGELREVGEQHLGRRPFGVGSARSRSPASAVASSSTPSGARRATARAGARRGRTRRLPVRVDVDDHPRPLSPGHPASKNTTLLQILSTPPSRTARPARSGAPTRRASAAARRAPPAPPGRPRRPTERPPAVSMSASGSRCSVTVEAPGHRAPLVELRGCRLWNCRLTSPSTRAAAAPSTMRARQRGTRPVALRLRRQRLRQPPLLAPLWRLELGSELLVHRRGRAGRPCCGSGRRSRRY